MDSDVAASVERARRRNKADAAKNGRGKTDENRFEQESRAFFDRVHSAYLAIAARETAESRAGRRARTSGGDPREDCGDCPGKAEACCEKRLNSPRRHGGTEKLRMLQAHLSAIISRYPKVVSSIRRDIENDQAKFS